MELQCVCGKPFVMTHPKHNLHFICRECLEAIKRVISIYKLGAELGSITQDDGVEHNGTIASEGGL